MGVSKHLQGGRGTGVIMLLRHGDRFEDDHHATSIEGRATFAISRHVREQIIECHHPWDVVVACLRELAGLTLGGEDRGYVVLAV